MQAMDKGSHTKTKLFIVRLPNSMYRKNTPVIEHHIQHTKVKLSGTLKDNQLHKWESGRGYQWMRGTCQNK